MNKTLKFLKDVYPIDITQPFIPAPISRDYVHTLQVVPAWTQAYQIHPWFVLDADWERSWMWVKTRQPV